MSSKLLLDEKPLLVMPKLACKIGLNESLILQQIHYWNEINKQLNNNFKDGYYWTFNSYEEWQKQFPFWSIKTIQRTINNLEKIKLVVSGNYNKMKIDRTKWYRIDYNALEILETSPFGQIDLTNKTKWLNHLDKLTKAIPETNPKINSKNNVLHHLSPNDDEYIRIYLWIMSQNGKEHKPVTIENFDYILSEISDWKDSVDTETWTDAVYRHFRKLPKGNDGDILAFLAAGYRYFTVEA